MNMTLKAVYFCTTNAHRWGKGLNPTEAKKNAGITTVKHSKGFQYVLYAAVFDNPNEDELENMRQCITANDFDGQPQFYRDNRLPEDTEMIERLLVGWLTVEKNF